MRTFFKWCRFCAQLISGDSDEIKFLRKCCGYMSVYWCFFKELCVCTYVDMTGNISIALV